MMDFHIQKPKRLQEEIVSMSKGDGFKKWSNKNLNSFILSEENRYMLPYSCPELWFPGTFKCSLIANIFEKYFIKCWSS